MSMEVIEKADEILKNHEIPDRASFFQLKNFVLGKERTMHGQIWACIRGIEDRREQIDALDLQIESSEDELKLLDIQIERLDTQKPKDPPVLWDQEVEIQLRKINREKVSLSKNIDKLKNKIRYILEELKYLTSAFESLEQVSGGVRDFDDAEAQRDHWNEKLTEDLNLSILLNRSPSLDLVHTILSLDDSMPVKKQTLQMFQKIQNQMVAKRDQILSEQSMLKGEKVGEVASVSVKKA